ncbi:MAG: sugar transferase [Planctomycetes bacterium]|nr:sugar transferase [Planctomycetota bacterium]
MSEGASITATDVAAGIPRGTPTVARRARNGVRLARALRHLSPTTWAYADLALVTIAVYLTHRLLIQGNTAYQWVVSPWLSWAAFSACTTVAGIIFGLYEQHTLRARSRIIVRSCMTLGVGVTLAYACMSVFFYAEVSRWLGFFVVLTCLGVGMPLRIIAHEIITSSPVHVLGIGAGDSVRKVAALLADPHQRHYRIVGHVVPPQSAKQPSVSPQPPIDTESQRAIHTDVDFARICPRLGSTAEIDRVLAEYPIDDAIVDAELTSDAAVGEAVLACLEKRCRVTDQPTFVEKLLGEVPAENITAQWFLLADVQTGGSYEAVKRIFDIAVSVIGLALTLPFWPLIALAIRLDDPGPAIFKQTRVGLHGRHFMMYKFRTMRLDAERDGARWAAQNDTRVTRTGRFLRKSRLDELPQLWNILMGEMAIVGPRPERPEFVEQLAQVLPHYSQRHLIKPGLTGWAQIHRGYGASISDAHRKLCFDLYYLKHRSIDFDVAVLIRTVGTFVLGSR